MAEAENVLIEVATVCQATVAETWMLRVPSDMAALLADDPDQAHEVLDQLDDYGVEFLGCNEEVSDEHERSVVRIRFFDAGGNLERTVPGAQ